MDNQGQQEDELLVLESIYNPSEFVRKENSNLLGGHLFIHHELPKDFKIIVKSYKQSNDADIREVIVSKVPPIDLDFTLPLRYPSESPPDFTLSCPWLSPVMLSELCSKLDNLWEENKGGEILFLWVDFLRENVIELFSEDNSISIDDLSTAYLADTSLINALSSLQIASTSAPDNCVDNLSKSSSASSSSSVAFDHNSERLEFQSDTNGEQSQAKVQCTDISPLKSENSEVTPVNSTICDSRVLIKNIDTPLHVILNEYNIWKTQEDLMKSQVLCNSCFDEKLGADCTQFIPCNHIFCKECVSCYFETQIKDNRIFSLGCLENKCESPASQAQIRGHVDPTLFEKYDKLLLDASLVVLSDIIYCPRKFCNYPVTREPNENLAVCPECKYPFCVLCKMTYHGIEKCKFNAGEKRALVLAYQNCDAKQREQMELRYGHRQLQSLLFDELSTQWITTNSKNCPNCSSPIEKNDGCNKMTCTKCGIFFCWVCGTCLSQDRPYEHFSKPTSKCFNLLFEGANILDDEFDALEEIDDRL